MKSRSELKQLITESSLKAIQHLEQMLNENNDTDTLNLLIVIKSNLAEIEKLNKIGSIQADEYYRERNKINLNILNIIDDLSPNYFVGQLNDNTAVREGQSEKSTPNKEAYEVMALIRELGELEIRESETLNPGTKGYINTKRYIIAMQAVRMIELYQVAISSLEYSMVAYAFFRSVDNVKAEQIYLKAIGNIEGYTDSAQSKISVMRSYANFLYMTSRYEDGAKQYESAILQGDTETNNVTNGHTFQSKFSNECDIPDYEGALNSYKMAKQYFMKINNSNIRNYNLRNLEAAWDMKGVPPAYTRP